MSANCTVVEVAYFSLRVAYLLGGVATACATLHKTFLHPTGLIGRRCVTGAALNCGINHLARGTAVFIDLESSRVPHRGDTLAPRARASLCARTRNPSVQLDWLRPGNMLCRVNRAAVMQMRSMA
jgi:hypothetical protein